jgi:hypothetical protein
MSDRELAYLELGGRATIFLMVDVPYPDGLWFA